MANETVNTPHTPFRTSITPWLSIPNAAEALRFYKSAFGAIETYRLDEPGAGVVARLSIDGAEFWLGDGPPGDSGPANLGCDAIRIILTVADPDALFAQALAHGATQVFPVSEDHGWKLGRLIDPFGLHWEIGHPLVT